MIVGIEPNEYIRNIKIRIAFITWSLEGIGGSEAIVYDVARKILDIGYFVYIFSFKDGPVRKLYESIGINVIIINKTKRIDIKLISDLVVTIKSLKIQIVYAHHITPFLYSFFSAKIARTKIIFTEHSVWQFSELKKTARLLTTIMMKNSDCIISISKQLQHFYLVDMKLKAEKIQLITNGIDFDKFKVFESGNLRKELGFETKDILIGIVANIRPEKNHKLLITAIEKLSKTYKNIKLLIIGLDCMNQEIHRFVEKCQAKQSIYFFGKRDDIPNLLNILDIFCLPSKNEGLPLTVVEAMACGVPIVGSDVMGINEVIVDGYNGLLFDVNNQDSLIEKIEIIINGEVIRKNLVNNAIKFAKLHFNIEDKIIDFDRVFRKILNKSASVFPSNA